MKKEIFPVFLAGIVVLAVSMTLLYGAILLFPKIMEEYYNDVFRSSSFETDWLFYAHPFVLSAALKWFWERYKQLFKGPAIMRGLEVGLVYGIVAMLPVHWLTFSAINISLVMVTTWLFYGIIQASIAGIIYAKLSS
jgi:hypothetical protein